MINIFDTSPKGPFSIVNLTERIENTPFQPGRIAELGIFTEQSTNLPLVAIEEQAGTLTLIPPTPRGGPGVTLPKVGRTMRAVSVPHFEINDGVYSGEVEGIRAFGTDNELETVLSKIVERQALHRQNLAVTQEYNRLGALTGVITYADGTTLDLFDTFGVVGAAEIGFDLSAASPVMGDLRQKCVDVHRTMANNMGGLPFRNVHAFVGDAFFDALVRHPEIRETMLGWSAAADLLRNFVPGAPTQSKIYGSFGAFDITWENYRGSVGSQTFVNTDKAYFFPTGVPNFAKTIVAPADYNETVNTMGRLLYERMKEMDSGKGWHFDTQMNALELITRPKALVRGRRTA